MAGPHGRRRGRCNTGRPDRAMGAAGRRKRYPACRGGFSGGGPATAHPFGSGEVHRRCVEHGIWARTGPRGADGAHGCCDRSRSGPARPATRFRGQDDADSVGRRRPGGGVQRTDRRHPFHPRRGHEVVSGENRSGDAFFGCCSCGLLAGDPGKPRRLSGRTHRRSGAGMVAPFRRLRIADRVPGCRLQRVGVVVP